MNRCIEIIEGMLKKRSMGELSIRQPARLMLWITPTDLQYDVNSREVNCEPWSECKINRPFGEAGFGNQAPDCSSFLQMKAYHFLIPVVTNLLYHNILLVNCSFWTSRIFVESLDRQSFSVRAEFYQPVAVCAENFRRQIFQTLQNFGTRMTEIISVTDTNHGTFRLDGAQKFFARTGFWTSRIFVESLDRQSFSVRAEFYQPVTVCAENFRR